MGAAVALVLAMVLAAPASPAFAAPVTIDQPGSGSVVETASVVVSGTAEVDPALGLPLATLDSVTVSVGEIKRPVANCSGKRTCTYRETFSLPLNGPYQADVVATPRGLLGGEQSRASRSFAVAAPAARPVLGPPRVTDSRAVELSWSRNTEPDMLHYAVFRKDPGATGYFQVGTKVPQPTSGITVTFTDTTTSLAAGGDYAYQVVAVRKGATGQDDAKASASQPSAAGAATVPVPPTTSTVAPAPGSPAPAGGPTTTAKPAPPAGVDLSGFLSSRSQPVTPPPITVPELPDTGFDGSLPFGARPPSEELEEGEAEAVLPDDARQAGSVVSRIDPSRPLVPVAGGLVLLLLALHMRVLGRRVKAATGDDLPVDLAPGRPVTAPPAPVVAASPELRIAAPEPQPQPQPRFYDVGADEDWEQHWAPPEPEPDRKVEVVTLWGAPEPEEPPERVAADPDAIEVFEVVAPTRPSLVRAGGR